MNAFYEVVASDWVTGFTCYFHCSFQFFVHRGIWSDCERHSNTTENSLGSWFKGLREPTEGGKGGDSGEEEGPFCRVSGLT